MTDTTVNPQPESTPNPSAAATPAIPTITPPPNVPTTSILIDLNEPRDLFVFCRNFSQPPFSA